MRLLLPKRYDLSDATFTRASMAYDEAGRLAGLGVPRIVKTAYGKMMMVEEGTTNLIPVVNQKFVGWNAVSGATITLAQNQVVSEWGTRDATRIQTNGGTSTIKYYYPVVVPSVSGQKYSVSIYIKNIGAVTVRVHPNVIGPVDVAPGEVKKVTINLTGDGVTSLSLLFAAYNISDSLDFIVWHPQVEPKPYPTLWTPGTRAAESLTMPTAGLSVSEGTIEGIVEITDVSKRQGSGNNMVFNISTGSNVLRLFHKTASSEWTLLIGETAYTYLNVADTLTPNALYFYRAPWKADLARIEFWNLSTKTKVGFAESTSPDLPSVLASVLDIGSLGASSGFVNAPFGKHRLSDIARTDDPDFDNLMPNDANTVAIFDPTYSFLT